jgi:cytoplasmic iron level regulating protein YaaA (DUF328/UPF0246 family)
MLILLPPSETKRSGGGGISIDKSAIIWAALDPARDRLIAEISKICSDPAVAKRVFKLGPKSLGDLEANKQLMSAPTLAAIERYAGVVYDAIDYPTLSEVAKQRVQERLFIQSALFGLLPATEQIPYYRFSASTKLPGLNLKALWIDAHKAVWPRLTRPILDMRSKAYAEINPIPENLESYSVDVFDQSGRALNHFNKKAKGLFVKSALENNLETIEQLPEIAKAVGLTAETDGFSVRLITPQGF